MALLLLLALAAAPDAGVSMKWKVTYTTSHGSDVGNGVVLAQSYTETVVTPSEVTVSAEGTYKGKGSRSTLGPRAIPNELRDAIGALLVKLPKASTTFSTSPYVNDEGWDNGGIAWELDGKVVSISLEQGPGNPPVPPEVKELIGLVAKANTLFNPRPRGPRE
jgi:hypothetical protein